MGDLVVTCPKGFWSEWIAEGDAAGSPPTGEEWGWYMAGRRPDIHAGDRLYVVAWDRVRGYAPVTRVMARSALHGVWLEIGPAWTWSEGVDHWCICRRGDAVAVTLPERVPGFRGWRRRWWPREHELPFQDWQTFGVDARRAA